MVEPSITILPAAWAVPEAITPKTVALKSIFLKSFIVIVKIELIKCKVKKIVVHKPDIQGCPSALETALQTRPETIQQRKNNTQSLELYSSIYPEEVRGRKSIADDIIEPEIIHTNSHVLHKMISCAYLDTF